MMIVESPTRRVLPARQKPIAAVVIHTTGSTDHAGILRFYKSPQGFQPHWYIQYDGTAHHIVDDAKVAYHCAIEDQEAELYAKGLREWTHWTWDREQNRPFRRNEECPCYAPWKEAWPALQSPLEMVTQRRPNSVSIGIELQEPTNKERTKDKFTDAQYEMLAQLLNLISMRHGVKLDRQHVLGHSDCSPMRRSNLTGPSDPGQGFNWEKVLHGSC